LNALLLADARFPAGGHVHSAGIEAAVADGRVRDEADLEAFVRGRLAAAAMVDASIAAAAHHRLSRPHDAGMLRALEDEAAARIPAPPLREGSRRLGRQLLRVASACWPHPVLDELVAACPAGACYPVALGGVGVAAELDTEAVAQLAAHHAVTVPAQAALRLLGLDPFRVAAITARALRAADVVVRGAVDGAAGPLEDLPARGEPLVEIAAMHHQRWDVRMFAT
jgi:urease accessory protein